ncbi:MAG TPA: cytochrome C, partial [Gammaproteobacteria bacterium]|nr:cytochrome C [Gammaproteobacteria bacterium]
LFYQALWAQAGQTQGSGAAVLWGIFAAAAILLGLGWGIFRAGVRLPLKAFFIASSALLFVLALVLAGKGMLALQEAGWITPVPVSFLRVDLLGIYPYAAPLALQGGLLALMGLSLVFALRQQGIRRQESDARA